MTGHWRERAACPGTLPESTWDLHLDGEFTTNVEAAARRRYDLAMRVCRRCPVAVECLEDAKANKGDGVRGGLLVENGKVVTAAHRGRVSA